MQKDEVAYKLYEGEWKYERNVYLCQSALKIMVNIESYIDIISIMKPVAFDVVNGKFIRGFTI